MDRKFISLGILFISSSQLYLSLLLTRFFSISQGYHWAFFVIGLALLGVGASGSFLSSIKLNKEKGIKIIKISSFILPFSIFLSYVINNFFPFDPFLLPWRIDQFFLWILNFISFLFPFFFIGLVVATSLLIFSEVSSYLYGITFLGGGLGIVILNIVLQFFDEFSSLIFSVILSLIGFIFLSFPEKKLRIIGKVILLLFTLLLIIPMFRIPIRLSPYKDLELIKRYPQTEILQTKRNVFSRFDLVKSPSIRYAPGLSYRYEGKIPYGLGFTIDGENLRGIIKENGFTDYLPQKGAFVILKNPRVLVIEPGGGIDIVLSKENNAKEIIGVTYNSFVGEILRENFKDKNIKIILENPRVFFKRVKENFDLIIFSLQESFHVITAGSYSLNENYFYTKESIKTSFSLLSSSGILCFTRWLQRPPTEELRLFVTIYYSLKDLGLIPEKHILVYRSLNTMSFLVKRTPFTYMEINKIKKFLEEKAFDIVYYFGIKEEEINKFTVLPEDIYYNTILELLEKKEDFIRSYPFKMDPPTDDKPFFFHFFKYSQIYHVIKNWRKTWQPFGGAGFIIIFILLFLITILSFFLILFPLIFKKASFPIGKGIFKFYLYFTFIGFSYLFVEISLMQKFILYLDQPIYSFSIILFSLLFFSGLGSFSSKFLRRYFPYTLFLLGFLIFSSLISFKMLIEKTLHFNFLLRIIISIFFTGILGFFMGIPFPTGLEIAKNYSKDIVPWVYAINGFSSVISSFSSSLFCISFGFSFISVIAGILYIISGILFSSYHGYKKDSS